MVCSFFFLFLFCFVDCGTDVGYFVHITDVHVDMKYVVGSDPECGKWTCCRENNTTNQKQYAGMFGSPFSTHCGVPIRTLDGVLEFVGNFDYGDSIKPTAIFFTGDNTVNDCDKQRGGCDRSHITGTIDLVNDHILEKLYHTGFCKPPECVILRSIGNHDGDPTDDTELMPRGKWLVDHFADFQDLFVDNKTATFFREKGYLSITLGKLKVIVINTQWTSAKNDWNKLYPFELKHPMYDFMLSELEESRKLGHKSIIVGHIPLVNGDLRNEIVWNEEFVKMSVEYSDNIVFSLWGHKHTNGFYLTRGHSKKAIGVHFLTGSVTNQGYRNSVFSMIKYNKTSNDVIDILYYYNDIEESNKQMSMKNNWKLMSMKEYYQINNFSPSSFDGILEKLKSDDKFYHEFLVHKYSNYRDNVECEGRCKKELLCSMEFANRIDYLECIL